MQTRGAIIRQAPGKYEVVDLEVDDPREDEVQVRLTASGLCHSDDHVATGDMPVGIYPMAGGHEGAGVITKVGPNTRGSRRATTSCSRSCPPAAAAGGARRGMQNLCDHGAALLEGRAGPIPPTSAEAGSTRRPGRADVRHLHVL